MTKVHRSTVDHISHRRSRWIEKINNNPNRKLCLAKKVCVFQDETPLLKRFIDVMTLQWRETFIWMKCKVEDASSLSSAVTEIYRTSRTS